ncbi:hypothetical protein BHE74_00003664 [Ensete ventricosum]|nr:hypothetical protein BHE74_00003664 [Ensete ventricosum]
MQSTSTSELVVRERRSRERARINYFGREPKNFAVGSHKAFAEGELIGRLLAAMKWFALCIISGTVVEGFLTKDHNNLDRRIPIIKAWITKEGCASRIARVSVANMLTNWAKGSSLPWAMPRSQAAMGFGWALDRKFCL